MSIDNSAVASVLGVSADFVDLRSGSVLFLPQRILLIAQGESSVSFSNEKWTATGVAATGNRYGFRSPIYAMMRALLPANGDGVGTIPVDVVALSDDGSGVAATGTVTPSGTMTKAGAFRLRVSGVLTKEFVLPEGAISGPALHNALRAMGNRCVEAIDLPMTVSYTYGSVTAGALTGTGNGTLTGLAVSAGKSPKPGVWTLKVNTAVANGGVWTLTDPDGVAVSTNITQTVGALTATAFTNAGGSGLDFTITDGATDFGLNATFLITVPATNLKLVSAWKGASANSLYIEVLGDMTLGASFGIAQPSGGLVNPTVDSALAKVGNVWETMAVNGLNIEDEVALDAYQAFGEARWSPLVRKPLVFFTGNTKTDVTAATAVCSTRRDDRVNAQLVAPGSPNLPCVVAARQAGLIARQANNNPPTSYQKTEATGIIAGSDALQWDYTTRDLAVKAGSSTVVVADEIVSISDVVTFYHPAGEEPPGFRKVVHIVRIQNAIFNTDIEFAKKEWAAAPIIADEDATTNENAKQPKSFKAKMNQILENLGDAAIIKNVAAAKKLTTAKQNAQNPDRVDLKARFPLSSNADIINVDLEFGFFGGAAA